MKYATLILILLSTNALAASPDVHRGFDKYFDALCKVESGNRPLKPHADTDGKLVIGYAQIKYDFWKDSRVKGSWKQCQNDREYAKRVVIGYYQRYCPQALKTGNWEVLAKCHNGGPSGYRKTATLGYWGKVQKAMR